GRLVPVGRAADAGAAHHPERHQPAPLRHLEGNHGGEEEGDSQGRRAAAGGEAARRSQGASMSVLVIAEQRGGTLNRATWETIAAAQQAGGPLRIAVAGDAVDGVAGELASADCERVIAVEHQALREYTADGFVLALSAVIEQEQPALVFLPHTYQTRDFAPALAARLGRALITDVTAFRKDGDRLVYVRPIFQGK